MVRLQLLIIPLLLASCMDLATTTTPEQDAAFREAYRAYMFCNARHGEAVAQQPGDPLSLGVAVAGMCIREREEIWRVNAEIYSPVVAYDSIEEIERDQIQLNAAQIVALRR